MLRTLLVFALFVAVGAYPGGAPCKHVPGHGGQPGDCSEVRNLIAVFREAPDYVRGGCALCA